MAGYSGTPLVAKLGIRPGDRVAIMAAPPGFAIDLPDGVTATKRLPAHADIVLFFTTERSRLDGWIDRLGQAVFPAGAIWVAWPKKTAKKAAGKAARPTDMTEDVVRLVALPLGLVDTKVCAIDDIWSGLKLVWRRERRDATRPGPP